MHVNLKRRKMTQREKIVELKMALMRVKSIASSIKSEGDDYDMQWHKSYCKQLEDVCTEALRKTK